MLLRRDSIVLLILGFVILVILPVFAQSDNLSITNVQNQEGNVTYQDVDEQAEKTFHGYDPNAEQEFNSQEPNAQKEFNPQEPDAQKDFHPLEPDAGNEFKGS